jgi:hypothetical protein
VRGQNDEIAPERTSAARPKALLMTGDKFASLEQYISQHHSHRCIIPGLKEG